jgi:spore cortex formation protein SpoVR/YcgB (stage V sporulation)
MNIESWTRAFVAEIYKPISEVTKDMMEAMQMYNFADNEEHNQIVAKVGSSVTSIDVAKEMFNNAYVNAQPPAIVLDVFMVLFTKRSECIYEAHADANSTRTRDPYVKRKGCLFFSTLIS